MRKTICFFSLIVLAIFLVLGCQAPAPTELEQQSNEIQTKGKSLSKIWPYVSDKQKETLAVNLLARNFVVILDGSGSMSDSGCSDGERKINVAKKAIVEWSKTLPPGSNLGLVAFHSDWTILELAPKEQSQKLTDTIAQVEPDGYTPLATAIKLAYGMLTKQAQRQLGYGEYTIIAVTDGEDNDRHESLRDWVNTVLDNSPVRIFTIGFCISGRHELNQTGRTIYKEANNPAELRKGLQEVLAEAESFDVKGFNK